MSRSDQYSILELETQESYANLHRSIKSRNADFNGMLADLSLSETPVWDEEDAALLN
jgi:hypothetical protein